MVYPGMKASPYTAVFDHNDHVFEATRCDSDPGVDRRRSETVAGRVRVIDHIVDRLIDRQQQLIDAVCGPLQVM